MKIFDTKKDRLLEHLSGTIQRLIKVIGDYQGGEKELQTPVESEDFKNLSKEEKIKIVKDIALHHQKRGELTAYLFVIQELSGRIQLTEQELISLRKITETLNPETKLTIR